MVISGLNKQCQHIAVYYRKEHTSNPPAPINQRLYCLLYNTATYNPYKYFKNKYLRIGQFNKPFLCLEYTRQGAKALYLVLNYNDWHVYCITLYGQKAAQAIQKVAGKTLYTRYIICNKHFKGILGYFIKAYIAKRLFSRAFLYLKYIRTKIDQSRPLLIQGLEKQRVYYTAIYRNVSSLALAYSINLLKKQIEIDRLIKHILEAKKEKKGKLYIGYAQPRHIKRLRKQDKHNIGVKRQ